MMRGSFCVGYDYYIGVNDGFYSYRNASIGSKRAALRAG